MTFAIPKIKCNRSSNADALVDSAPVTCHPRIFRAMSVTIVREDTIRFIGVKKDGKTDSFVPLKPRRHVQQRARRGGVMT